MKKVVLIGFILFSTLSLSAQLDSVFWFVAPEVSYGYSHTFDRPIKLNVASFNNFPVNITISQPANVLFTPITAIVPVNGQLTIDLTSNIAMIENQPINTVLPFGLLIQATGIVNVYYEVNMTGLNPEMYSLKGSNALGTDFMIPGQTNFGNGVGSYFQPQPVNRFDIVATENNTIVTITPSKAIVGHAANVSFNIQLNRGQTYSCVAINHLAVNHLDGSIVTSNKPIAITLTDDLLHHPYGGQDLVGDQITPINIIGNEYIAVKGSLYNNENIYILATENNTSIYVNGNTIPATTINKGQTHVTTFASGDDAIYFTSNKPVYAFQLTGTGREFGGALLPPIECTGSKQIRYKRVAQRDFKINICVSVSGINGFLVNGSSTVITASDFSAVPGTNNQWYYASKNISLSLIPQNSIISITNTSNFHAGIFEGDLSGGCTYGFFSDYGTQYNIQASTNKENVGHSFCIGDNLELFIKDTIGFTDIQWTFPDNSIHYFPDTIISNISFLDSGMYIVNANSASVCMVKADTIYLKVDSCKTPTPSIVCTQIHYSTENTRASSVYPNVPVPNTYLPAAIWTWQGTPGISRAYIKFDLSNIFSTTNTWMNTADLYLFNPYTSDPVIRHEYQSTTLPVQLHFHRVTASWSENTLTWNNQPTFDTSSILSPVFCTQSNPSYEDLTLNLNALILNNRMLYSNYNGLMFRLVQEDINNRYRIVTFEGRRYHDSTYWPRLEIEYEFYTMPTIDYYGQNTFEAKNVSDIEFIFDDIVYKWTINKNTYYGKIVQPPCADTFDVTLEMTLVNRLKDSCHYYIGDTICAALYPNIELSLEDTITTCLDSVEISANYPNANYLWSTGETTETITVKTSGTYWVEVNNYGCFARDTLVVVFSSGFTINLEDTLVLCNSSVVLDAKYPNADYYLWNTGDTTKSITVNTSGMYWVEVSSYGCVLRDTVEVQEVKLELDQDMIICDSSIILNAYSSNPDYYLWSTGETTKSITVAIAGLYWVEIGKWGCVLRDSTFVRSSFVLNLEDTVFMCEEPVVLYSNLNQGQFLWSTGETTKNISVSKPGIYWLEVMDLQCLSRDTIIVIQRSIPPFEIQTMGDFCKDNNLQLFVNIDMDNVEYLWNTGESSSIIFAWKEGTYLIEVSNENCSTISSITIEPCPCDLWLPNIFTPNGDLVNEGFLPIFSAPVQNFSMYIFDRWGSLIYKTNELKPWDGSTKNGKIVSAGVYYCVVSYSCSNEPEKIKLKNSSVTLIR